MRNKGKIYTRTGDKGQTSLFGGKRVLKSDSRVETYGTVDELNSLLGVVIAHLSVSEEGITHDLELIQHDLLTIGSALANPEKVVIVQLVNRVEEFEKKIDFMTESLPELHNFILPGGGQPGAFLHVARTVCRRAERKIVALSQNELLDDGIRMYFNRLSDYLFTLAREVNQREEKRETIWVKNEN